MFEPLMEAYKNMNQNSKGIALIKELKKLIDILQNICMEKGISFRQISIKEMFDLNNSSESIDEYLNVIFVYVKYLEELIGSYLEETLT